MAEQVHVGIVLRVAADRTAEFEAMFEAEEVPIWDDFTSRDRFLETQLIKVEGGSQAPEGIQDYLLYVVAADEAAHHEHDHDPRFKDFLERALKVQPLEPLVWFGRALFERRALTSG